MKASLALGIMGYFFRSPFWKIIVGSRYSNCRYLLFILPPLVLTTALEGISFALIYLALSVISGQALEMQHLFSFLSAWHWLEGLSPKGLFYTYIMAALAFQLFRSLISFIAYNAVTRLSVKVQTEAQKKIYQQIFSFSFPFISQYKQGYLTELVKSPIYFIPQLFTFLNRFFVSFFISVGLLAVMSWISPLLTLVTLSLFLFVFLFQKFLVKQVAKFSKELTDHVHKFSHETEQALSGIRHIYSFNKHGYILSKINLILKMLVNSSTRAHYWNNTIYIANETINIFLVASILIIGGFLIDSSGGVLISSLLTYIALTYRFGTRIQEAMRAIGDASLHFGSIKKFNEILEEENKEYLSSSSNSMTCWNKDIVFDNVSLKYPHSSNYALKNISFSITKGSTVAIVGASGAGKSSILDLLLKLYEPNHGEILIDSQPLASISRESWLKKLGVVSQDSFLFNGSIDENIRFGDLEATDEAILKSSFSAGISNFIKQLPNKYETVVGDKGYKLSGGEKQRISLARALLRNPEILILDEATSNLDSFSENLIQNSLENLDKGKTTITVAHRLSTITHADKIIVLEKGEVVEVGTHEELLQAGARYSNLWKLQSEKKETTFV